MSYFSTPVRRTLSAILLVHFIFACIYNFAIPFNKGPDELGHYAYVKHLVQRKSFPVLRNIHETRDHETEAIAIHPPLYYSLCVPPYLALRSLPDTTIQHLLRFLATLMGAASLLLIARAVREMLPGDEQRIWPVVAFVAFLPHFLLLSSVMNNDGLLILLSSLFMLWSLRIVRNGGTTRDFARLGLLYGLMLLTKASALAFFPLGLGLAIWAARRVKAKGGVMTLALKNSFAFYLLAIPIGGWWYARFQLMIGRIQPIPLLPEYDRILLKSPLDLFFNPAAPILVVRYIMGVMRSIWGQADWFLSPVQLEMMRKTNSYWDTMWGPVGASQPGLFIVTLWVYRLFVLLAIGGCIGLVWALLDPAARTRAFNGAKSSLAYCVLFFGLLYGALFHYTLFTHPGGYEGGRYLLPTVGAYALLFISGWRAFLPQRAMRPFFGAMVCLLLVWNIGCAYNLIGVLNPLYEGR
jgi:hypothetical protein